MRLGGFFSAVSSLRFAQENSGLGRRKMGVKAATGGSVEKEGSHGVSWSEDAFLTELHVEHQY